MAAINDSNENILLGPIKVVLFSLTVAYNSGGSTYLKSMWAESTHITNLSPGRPVGCFWLGGSAGDKPVFTGALNEICYILAWIAGVFWKSVLSQFFFPGRNFSYPMAAKLPQRRTGSLFIWKKQRGIPLWRSTWYKYMEKLRVPRAWLIRCASEKQKESTEKSSNLDKFVITNRDCLIRFMNSIRFLWWQQERNFRAPFGLAQGCPA